MTKIEVHLSRFETIGGGRGRRIYGIIIIIITIISEKCDERMVRCLRSSMRVCARAHATLYAPLTDAGSYRLRVDACGRMWTCRVSRVVRVSSSSKLTDDGAYLQVCRSTRARTHTHCVQKSADVALACSESITRTHCRQGRLASAGTSTNITDANNNVHRL